MSDSSDVDEALVALLLNDAPLQALQPDGVFFDVAAPAAQRFIIVAQSAHADDHNIFGGNAGETFTYLVKAVSLASTGGNLKAAAARIHSLMTSAPVIPGYHLQRLQRIERVRYTEVDPDHHLRWGHRGGVYEVEVHPV